MIIRQEFSVPYNYDIHFTTDLFNVENELLYSAISGREKETKIAAVIDRGLFNHWPDLTTRLGQYFKRYPAMRLAADPLIIPGGEAAKNDDKSFQLVLQLIDQAKIDRHSYIMALGGGALLDMVGFACSIGHRGIRHIRIPTTVLAQNDSGIGVKNGINYFNKKNFLGAFAPPNLVINDFAFLETLEDRDWRAGTAEAVKVAAIKDLEFFQWLEDHALQINQRVSEPMKELIFRCAKLHAQHITENNDPFERGSSRPLDFGHWAAHKLEQLTNYELRHGEAVAIGLALDLEYAVLAGFLDQTICDQICRVLRQLGFNLFHPAMLNLDHTGINAQLLDGLDEFREHLGGQLTITMISEIGKKFDIHEMSDDLISTAAVTLQKKEVSYAN